MKPTPSTPIDLDTLPGYHIRRLHQIAVAIFLQELEPNGLTPVQYAVMQAVANAPGIRLAEAPSFGQPILTYDPRSRGAESYIKLAKEIISNEQRRRQSQSAG